MTETPDLTTTLVDLAEGRLDPETARAVAGRLEAGGASVAATRAWVRWFLATSAAVTFSPAPADVVARLHGLMPARPSLAQRLATAAGGVVAQLVQDLQAGPMLAGARGVSAGEARQLLFEAGDGAEVSVSVLPPVDGRTRIDGQLFDDAPSRPVRLAVDDDLLVGTADPAGEFSFPMVVLPTDRAEVCLTIETAAGPVHIDLTPYVAAVRSQEQP